VNRQDLRLYLVTDPIPGGARDLFRVCEEALASGVKVIQLRDKSASCETLMEQGKRLTQLAEKHGATCLINDKPEIAAACGAHGVHLGQEDARPDDARRILGDEAVIGVSVQTAQEARQAECSGADYLAANLVFATATKTDLDNPIGLDGVRALRLASSLPLVAIGGIHSGNADKVIAAGADGVAVVSAIMGAADVAGACRELIAAVGKGMRLRHG
jgi:thiamine-phosphate pyrophosphorylase